MLDWMILLIFPAFMAYAAVSDLLTMTISNRVSLLLIVAFAIMALLTQMPLILIGWHMLAAALMLVVTFFFFARGWMGGGDAKIASATMLWLGFDQMLNYALMVSIWGGALTIGLLMLRSAHLHPQVLVREGWYARLTHPKTGIPYGIALALAGLAIYPHSHFMQLLGR